MVGRMALWRAVMWVAWKVAYLVDRRDHLKADSMAVSMVAQMVG